ncbi:hypothetical protein [Nocardioides coralli]|uniref:hypothetical protein n=1 Tax=Nocardioides coralli TaxID=2872154 RepID=UPI001CA3D80F|nr:hypothetical protein [Nocardioides coralli]QZY29722.1 hypothetical protein K6T13_03240 [Nocardioides coralli]
MTITTAHPGHHHISVKSAALAMGGALLTVGAGFGIAALTGDDVTSPGRQPAKVVNTGGAWDSWDRRGNRNSVPGTENGVRDSWMRPGTTDRG